MRACVCRCSRWQAEGWRRAPRRAAYVAATCMPRHTRRASARSKMPMVDVVFACACAPRARLYASARTPCRRMPGTRTKQPKCKHDCSTSQPRNALKACRKYVTQGSRHATPGFYEIDYSSFFAMPSKRAQPRRSSQRRVAQTQRRESAVPCCAPT